MYLVSVSPLGALGLPGHTTRDCKLVRGRRVVLQLPSDAKISGSPFLRQN